MPEPAEIAGRVLASEWRDSAAFFARADKELGSFGVGFRALFAAVPRRIGARALARPPLPAELATARAHWTLVDYARLWLLDQALARLPADDAPGSMLALFEAGELGEQVSILRVLAALPAASRFVEVGVQACRTNAKDVFEAIVCENAFLAAYFEPLSFNQAIMKAVFMQVPLGRVEGLEPRITPELVRMAAGYASERRAAGRSVPADVDYLSRYRG